MDEAAGPGGEAVTAVEATGPDQRSPEEIQRDIDETREELGDTAAALAQKADVKGQAKAKAEDVKQHARAKAEGVKEAARQKKSESTSKAREAAPDSATGAAEQAASTAQQNPVPLAIGGAFVAGLAVGLLLRR